MNLFQTYKETNYKSELGKNIFRIKDIHLFLDKFSYIKPIKEEYIRSEQVSLSLYSVDRMTNVDSFLEVIEKKLNNFNVNLKQQIENKTKEFVSIENISFSNGTVWINGKKKAERELNLIYLFEESLAKTEMSIFYKGLNQNNVLNEDVLTSSFCKKTKTLSLIYKQCELKINLRNFEGKNIGHFIRKGLKRKNFKDLILYFIGVKNGRFNQIHVEQIKNS